MSPFLNLLFEQDSYSNAYLLAKCCFDTAENEPAKNLQKFPKFANFADPTPLTLTLTSYRRMPADHDHDARFPILLEAGLAREDL